MHCIALFSSAYLLVYHNAPIVYQCDLICCLHTFSKNIFIEWNRKTYFDTLFHHVLDIVLFSTWRICVHSCVLQAAILIFLLFLISDWLNIVSRWVYLFVLYYYYFFFSFVFFFFSSAYSYSSSSFLRSVCVRLSVSLSTWIDNRVCFCVCRRPEISFYSCCFCCSYYYYY